MALTPYDTGEIAEPHIWPIRDSDGYGLVDFDDDESSTVATVIVTADGSGGWIVEVTAHRDNIKIKDQGVL